MRGTWTTLSDFLDEAQALCDKQLPLASLGDRARYLLPALIAALRKAIKDRDSYIRYPACDDHGAAEPDVLTVERIERHNAVLLAILEGRSP